MCSMWLRRCAALLLACSAWAYAAPGYFRYPALHNDTLVFTAEGDLWRVPLAGGKAQRLTTHAGQETRAAISPDGQWIAFTAGYEGPFEVYVMPLAGGLPTRLTYEGETALGLSPHVVAWSLAGDVLYSSIKRNGQAARSLMLVNPTTRVQTPIALADATDGGFASATSLIFTRHGLRSDNVKRYRGGAMASLWRFDTAQRGMEAQRITDAAWGNSSAPAVWSGRVYFLSDRDGAMNLWSMTTSGTDAKQHTRHRDWDIRSLSVSNGKVAYTLGADVRVLDLASGEDRVVPIELVSDFDQLRERWIKRPLENFGSLAFSPDGERVALVARGRAAIAGLGAVRRVDLPQAVASRTRGIAFMSDGKSLITINDASDEMELWQVPANGIGAPKQLTKDASVLRYAAYPSPDGKWIAHHDKDNRLWLLEVATGKNEQIERNPRWRYQALEWAPDSSAFVVEQTAPDTANDQLMLFTLAGRKKTVLTSPRYESFAPAFTPDGKWLYFLSNRQLQVLNTSGPWGDRNMGPYFDKRTKIYAIALQPGNRFPFQPKDELDVKPPESAKPTEPPDKPEPSGAAPKAATPVAAAAGDATKAAPAKAASPKITPITLDGIAARLFEVPLPSGNYSRLATDGKRLYFLEAETTPERKTALKTMAIENVAPTTDVYMADVREFRLSQDGKKLLIRKWAAGAPGAAPPGPGDIFIFDAGQKAPPPPPEQGKFQVRVNDWQFPLDPRDEWRQLFVDAWRMHRDYFYDKNMHGVDWKAMRKKYEALLPRVTDRAELADVMAQMSSELSLLHSQIGPGDTRKGEDNVQPASLGAELSRVASGARIDRIYRGDPELVSELPPLARPEVGAKEGDVITAVDGLSVKDVPDISVLLRDKGGKQTLLVLQGADGKTRQAIVLPAPPARERQLRQTDWEFDRRARVERASQGRFGYVHLWAMGPQDIARFAREFYPAAEREGLIIDVRYNGGGNIDSWIIEKLMRRAWAYWKPRSSDETYYNMQRAFRGHIVVLMNERTYSDGETFALGMQRLKLGTLIGKRTSGAGVWLSDGNTLADGGIARAAENGQFGLDGQWVIEGTGVTPDIEVDNPPHASYNGADAQLDAAITHLQQKLREQPLQIPKVPAYPVIGK